MTLKGIYELRQQPVLIGAATAACMVAGEAIRNEAVNAPNHAARIAWFLQSPDSNAREIMSMIAMNSTIQTKWEERTALNQGEWLRFDDGDIQFLVNAWVGAFVLD